MPRGNQTGPMGMGSMTGRGAGYCAGSGMPGYANDTPGRGFGGGLGRGRRSGSGFFGRGRQGRSYAAGRPQRMRSEGYGTPYAYPPPDRVPDPDMEKQALNNQARLLQSELDEIKKRLAKMEAETGEE